MRILKVVLFFFLVLFFSLPSFAEEYSKLYIIKNIDNENLNNFAKVYLQENEYKYFYNDGYLISEKLENNTERKTILIIKQVEQNSYFYYWSDDKDKTFFKNIFKRIKASGLKTKKVGNDELISVFREDAIKLEKEFSHRIADNESQVKSDIDTKYDFSDEAQASFDAQYSKYNGLKIKGKKTVSENKNVQIASQNEQVVFSPTSVDITFSQNSQGVVIPFSPLKGSVVQIPKGSIINAVLQSAISSQSISENDVITATLEQDWIYNGVLIAPAGSILYGHVVDAQKAGYAFANGEIEITFTEILTLDAQRFPLSANLVKLDTGINRAVKVSSKLISGALMGVMAGTLYALISGGDVASGIAWGAGVGTAGGAVTAVANKGQEVEIPAGTNLQIKLTEDMNVTPVY